MPILRSAKEKRDRTWGLAFAWRRRVSSFPALFGALSLGVVITAKAIEYAIENGRKSFDFLRGNETYKYRFGAQDTTIYRIHLEPAS